MVQTMSGVKQNLWRKQQSGLYAPARRNFPIDGLALYLPLWEPSQASLLNGTGIATGAPLVLVGPAAQTITVTQAGTFKIYLQAGQTGTATAGTMAVTGSPVALVGGLNTITTTGATGNFTVAVPTVISKDLNAHVATITGAIQGLQGRTFDGDDKIVVPQSAAIPSGAADRTVLVWYKPTTDFDIARYFLSYGEYLEAKHFGLFTQTLGGFWFGAHSYNLNANYNLTLNTWYLLGVTLYGGGDDMIAYVNGASVASTTFVVALNTTASDVNIGCRIGDANYAKGVVGEFWLPNRALTGAEMMRVYQTTKWRYI